MIAHVIKDGVVENIISVDEGVDLTLFGAQVIADGEYYHIGDSYSGNIDNDASALQNKKDDMEGKVVELLAQTAVWESDSYDATPEQIAYRRSLEALSSEPDWPHVTIPERP